MESQSLKGRRKKKGAILAVGPLPLGDRQQSVIWRAKPRWVDWQIPPPLEGLESSPSKSPVRSLFLNY